MINSGKNIKIGIVILVFLFIANACKKSDNPDKEQSLVKVKANFTIAAVNYDFIFENDEDCSAATKKQNNQIITAIAVCDKSNQEVLEPCLGNYISISLYGDKTGVYPGVDTNNDGIPESTLGFWQKGELIYTSLVNDENSSFTITYFGEKEDYIIGTYQGELLDIKKSSELSTTILVPASGEFKAYINVKSE